MQNNAADKKFSLHFIYWSIFKKNVLGVKNAIFIKKFVSYNIILKIDFTVRFMTIFEMAGGTS